MNPLRFAILALVLTGTAIAQVTPPPPPPKSDDPPAGEIRPKVIEVKTTQEKGKPETKKQEKTPAPEAVPQVDPIVQLKNSLQVAKRECDYLGRVQKEGGLLARFQRNRAAVREMQQRVNPAPLGPAMPSRKSARLLGDAEKARLGDKVVFTVAGVPVTQEELDAMVSYLGSYPRKDNTTDVKTHAILALVKAKAGEGLHPKEANAARAALTQAHKKLEGGESFGDLAKAISDDKASAANGGALDWMVRGTADECYARHAFALKPGQVSPVFCNVEGFHIVRVLGTKRGETADLDRVRTSHIVKRFTDARGLAQLQQKIASGSIDLAFRTDELRKLAPAQFR
ncbi:MAG: peptidylprolyl isomerase [Planctomycetes bacterium]|nr:peptidylprolyl isomerase [Planctomycetota bacterium]